MSKETPAPASPQAPGGQFVFRLYVAGSTPQSSRAITNIKKICEAHLKDRYSLTVMDVYEQNANAAADQIMVAPTLIRQLPLPERRLFGDLSHTPQVLEALDLLRAPGHP
jgi:circadian clock protein KaiB